MNQTIKRGVGIYFVLILLCVALWGSVATGTASAGQAHVNATYHRVLHRTAPSSCAGVKDYVKELGTVMTSTPGGKAFLALADMEGEDLMAMTPTEIASYESKLRTLARDLDELDPPPAAEAMHDDLVKIVQLYANMFNSAETVGFPFAALPYVDTMETVGNRFIAEADALTAACGTSPSL